MANLSLYLLGPALVSLDEEDIEVKPRKALALLIYLAITAEPQTRDYLATLLWPESDQSNARRALRNRLSELNQALNGEWLAVDRESVGLRAGYWLDVTEFQRHLAKGADERQSLMAAAGLYRDDFLTGFTLPDCPEYDEWQFFQGESYRQALAAALERLIELLSGQGEYQEAIPYARRWLALDPLHEPAQRELMRLYARSGQRAAALRQYELTRETLERELGVAPAQETETLYQDIQAGRVGDETEKARPRHNLPVETTSFIGRQTELANIKHLLLGEPGCRLLNLVGPGGIGKTRLALATAAQTVDAFADGAYFVPLASVGEADHIVPAVADALRYTFRSQTDPRHQLLEYLRQKQLLLVMDNFEHLLDGVDLLSDILSVSPEVTFLTTTRENLNLQEEWSFDVQGLPFPAGDELSAGPARRQDFAEYSAVQLFLQRARQATPGFAPSTEEMASIGRICQMVEGMPLALELAAPWIKVLNCQEIAAEIEGSLDFLATTLQNVPERHRSLRAIFEQTWRQLSAEERSALRQLSVFRGGCTRELAQEVTNATLPVLSSLADKALIRRTNTGRFELHELIRQFAADRLAVSGDEIATKQKHLDAMAELARKGEQQHYGSPIQLEWHYRLEAEHANMRAASDWGLNNDLKKAAALATANWLFYFRTGHFREAQKTYDALLNRGDQLPDDLLAWVLNSRCSVALGQGDIEALESFATQALDRFERLEDDFGIGLSYHHLASVSTQRGDFERTRQLVDLGIEAAGNNLWLRSLLLHSLVHIEVARNDFDQAAQKLLAMLASCERIHDGLSALYYRMSLAEIEVKRKNLAQARDLLLRIQADNERYREVQIIGWVQELFGLVALASGEVEKAVSYIQQAIVTKDRVGGDQDKAQTSLLLGLAQTEAHRFTKAREALLAGAEVALDEGRQPVTLDLLEHLSRLDWLERQNPASLRNLSAAATARSERQIPLAYPFDLFINQTVDQIRDTVDAQQFEALWQEGSNLDPVLLLQEVVEFGL